MKQRLWKKNSKQKNKHPTPDAHRVKVSVFKCGSAFAWKAEIKHIIDYEFSYQLSIPQRL